MSTVSIERAGVIKFDFSDYYPDAILNIQLNRTLRVPDVANDKGSRSKLPPGLGTFETVSTESLGDKFPTGQQAGIIMPMFQSEAAWFGFSHSRARYPFMIKIAAGGINAITGDVWQDGPSFGAHEKQDYVTAPSQPWIDGFKTGEGIVRQFVAVPLGKGLTVEEQLRGEVKFGGIQFVVHPIDKDYFEKVILPERARQSPFRLSLHGGSQNVFMFAATATRQASSMGLAAGGQIEQRIEKDRHGSDKWVNGESASLFIHIANSKDWMELTGRAMPRPPLSASDYTLHGGKWFDYYSDTDVTTAPALTDVKSPGQIADAAGLPTDEPQNIPPSQVVDLMPSRPVKQWDGKKETDKPETNAGITPAP